MDFNTWLINKGLSVNIALYYHNFIEKKFKVWLHENQASIEYFEHEHLMHYIRYRKSQNIQPKTINAELLKIGYFLEFKELINVAESIRIRGVMRRIPHNLFTEKELDNMYEQFLNAQSFWSNEAALKRYHITLGLKIYQGLQESEMARLETSHLQLDKGRIYIPSIRRTNKRILDLKPFQILALHQYILTERVDLLDEIEGQQLFPRKRLKRCLPEITNRIRRYEPRLHTLMQIRPSVITNWLNHYNLREVQYMAGHKYVSSTERYRTDNLEDLQEELKKYHPLNKP